MTLDEMSAQRKLRIYCVRHGPDGIAVPDSQDHAYLRIYAPRDVRDELFPWLKLREGWTITKIEPAEPQPGLYFMRVDPPQRVAPP